MVVQIGLAFMFVGVFLAMSKETTRAGYGLFAVGAMAILIGLLVGVLT